MPITVSCQPVEDDQNLVLNYDYYLQVYGYFEFSDYQQWHAILDKMTAEVRSVAIDFSAIDYMDSSALGLLLQLKDRFTPNKCPMIKLVKVNQTTFKLLQRSGLDQLFELDRV